MSEQAYEIIELAKKTGSLKRGTNEVTKAIERGKAAFVAVAEDVSPKEITMHIPMIAKEKGIPCAVVPSREELGTAAGLAVPSVAIAVMDAGEAKDMVAAFKAESAAEEKAPAKEEKAEEPAKEEPKEEAAEEKEDSEQNADEQKAD